MIRCAVTLAFLGMASQAWAVNITSIAAWTTIAVNGETIAKTIRHPKKTAKSVAKKVKDTVKGK